MWIVSTDGLFLGIGMHNSDISRLIHIIACGKIFTEYRSIPIILHPASSDILARSCLVYENGHRSAIRDGLMTEQELIKYHISEGEWSVQQESQMEMLKQTIKEITKRLLSLYFQKTKLEQSRQLIRKAEQKLYDIASKRQALLFGGAENYATLKQQHHIISNVAMDDHGSLVCEHLETITDMEFIKHLTHAYFIDSIVPHKALRLIARSGEWKHRWMASKISGQIFDNPLGTWTLNQQNLVAWAHTYDMVYEAYERPSQDIIEDDDVLDSWLINESDKMDVRSKQTIGDSILGKTPDKKGRNEKFVMTDQAGSKEVYKMNDPMTRMKVAANSKVIAERGEVEEAKLPMSQHEIREQLR